MATLGDKAAKGTVVLLASQLCVMASSYVIAVLLARSLGPVLFGAYGMVYSFLLSVELIGRLGLPQAVSRLIAERNGRAPAIEAAGVTLAVVVYLVIFVMFWSAAPWLAALFNVADGTEFFRIAALDIPFYGMYFMLMNILNGRRQFGHQAVSTVVYYVSKAIGIVVLVLIEPSVEGALLVNVAGSIVAVAFVAYWVGRRPFRLSFTGARPIVRIGAPVAVAALGTQTVASADLWVLNALTPHAEDTAKGFYVAATNVARLSNFVAYVLSSVLLPSLAHARALGTPEEAARAFDGAMRFMVVTLVPGCALVAVEAREIMALLFSRTYADGGPLLAILIFSHGLAYTAFLTFSNVLVAIGRQRLSALIAIAMLAVSVVASLVGVSLLGAFGAALGALVAMSTAATIVTIFVVQALRPPFRLGMLARVLLLTALVCSVAGAIPSAGLWLLAELALLAAALLLLMLLFGILRPADFESVLPSPFRRAAL